MRKAEEEEKEEEEKAEEEEKEEEEEEEEENARLSQKYFAKRIPQCLPRIFPSPQSVFMSPKG